MCALKWGDMGKIVWVILVPAFRKACMWAQCGCLCADICLVARERHGLWQLVAEALACAHICWRRRLSQDRVVLITHSGIGAPHTKWDRAVKFCRSEDETPYRF